MTRVNPIIVDNRIEQKIRLKVKFVLQQWGGSAMQMFYIILYPLSKLKTILVHSENTCMLYPHHLRLPHCGVDEDC